jgi:hypothetical protein
LLIFYLSGISVFYIDYQFLFHFVLVLLLLMMVVVVMVVEVLLVLVFAAVAVAAAAAAAVAIAVAVTVLICFYPMLSLIPSLVAKYGTILATAVPYSTIALRAWVMTCKFEKLQRSAPIRRSRCEKNLFNCLFFL